jgi:two-component system copper resistance phosphate regulon response regulator CusR
VYKGNVHILVVEDDTKMAETVRTALVADAYSVRVTHSGEEGFFLAQAHSFDLMILDLMLPGHDGFEILATLRKQENRVPVLIITAKDGIEDRVRGLDLGADDYLVKPFAVPELLARVRVLLRRGKPEGDQTFTLTDLEMDVAKGLVTRAGEVIDLSAREFELLEYLFRNRGRVISREMLARDVWKEVARHTPLDNVIDSQMTRLRRKIDGPFQPKLLHTIRGVGFVLRESPKS